MNKIKTKLLHVSGAASNLNSFSEQNFLNPEFQKYSKKYISNRKLLHSSTSCYTVSYPEEIWEQYLPLRVWSTSSIPRKFY